RGPREGMRRLTQRAQRPGCGEGPISGGLDDLAGLDAPGAREHALVAAAHGGADLLEIRQRAGLVLVVRVADGVADERPLAADFALKGHDFGLLDGVDAGRPSQNGRRIYQKRAGLPARDQPRRNEGSRLSRSCTSRAARTPDNSSPSTPSPGRISRLASSSCWVPVR